MNERVVRLRGRGNRSHTQHVLRRIFARVKHARQVLHRAQSANTSRTTNTSVDLSNIASFENAAPSWAFTNVTAWQNVQDDGSSNNDDHWQRPVFEQRMPPRESLARFQRLSTNPLCNMTFVRELNRRVDAVPSSLSDQPKRIRRSSPPQQQCGYRTYFTAAGYDVGVENGRRSFGPSHATDTDFRAPMHFPRIAAAKETESWTFDGGDYL